MKQFFKGAAALLSYIIVSAVFTLICGCVFIACEATTDNTKQNITDTKIATESLLGNQKSPTDIDYSLERYNLIKRAYWVNGQREKAAAVPCPVDRPIGYIVLVTGSGSVLGTYTVDGKITSLNSFLSPDSEYYSSGDYTSRWLADVDGSYGQNIDGVFWFTIDGKYMEWNGQYVYSDIPFVVEEPVLKVAE